MSRDEVVDLKTLPVHEMDSNVLFEKFTVDEIRDIEKKSRSSIERKKEELRVMVGERYRELIGAADVISDMKKSTENIVKSVTKMEETCQQLKQNYMLKGSSYHEKTNFKATEVQNKEMFFYGVAAQIKLLIDMPEKIWSAIDNKDYLTATRFYLLSRHINTSLHLDTQHSNILACFPVLSRQWAAISHFKSSILQGCRQTLRETDCVDQQTTDCLCSILLLEDSTTRQVFNEFLLARTNALQMLLSPNQHGSSVKEQVCKIVQLIITTVHQIHAIFYKNSDMDKSCTTNLLVDTSKRITGETMQNSMLLDDLTSASARCLPKSVKDFHPMLRASPVAVASQQLNDNCREWINTCSMNVKTGIFSLLNYVNTVKRLTDIRDAVWEHMVHNEQLKDWESVCERILSKKLSIWVDFLRPLFLDRVKTLIKSQLEVTTEMMKKHTGKVILEIDTVVDGSQSSDKNFSKLLWSESTTDILPNLSWMTASNKNLLEGGGLVMKAKGHTQSIQSLCKSYDDRLKILIDDNHFYIETLEDCQPVENSPFNKHGDADEILKFMQDNCSKYLQDLLNHLEEQINLWKETLTENSDMECNLLTICKILLIGRLCAGICELTPNLEKCVLVRTEKRESRKSVMKLSLGKGQKVPEDPHWSDIKSKLLNCQIKAFTVWSDYTAEQMIKSFSTYILSGEGPVMLSLCTRWDEVEIQEETEDGKQLKSSIKVPMQTSWIFQELLNSICKEIHRIGGHSLNRLVLLGFLQQMSDGLVNCYEQLLVSSKTSDKLMHCSMNQAKALQLLFDMRVLQQIIPRKEESPENKKYQTRLQKLIESVEEYIDPFDFDVFSPYLSSNINKYTQRVAILYGSLINLDKHGLMLSSMRAVAGSQQEQHNVLPLTTCQNRFPLLPIGTQQTHTSIPQHLLNQTVTLKNSSDSVVMSLTDVAASVIPRSTSVKDASGSLYDRLGGMWFSKS